MGHFTRLTPPGAQHSRATNFDAHELPGGHELGREQRFGEPISFMRIGLRVLNVDVAIEPELIQHGDAAPVGALQVSELFRISPLDSEDSLSIIHKSQDVDGDAHFR